MHQHYIITVVEPGGAVVHMHTHKQQEVQQEGDILAIEQSAGQSDLLDRRSDTNGSQPLCVGNYSRSQVVEFIAMFLCNTGWFQCRRFQT